MEKESKLGGYIIEDNKAYCTLNESCIYKSKTKINNKYPCDYADTDIAAYYLYHTKGRILYTYKINLLSKLHIFFIIFFYNDYSKRNLFCKT
ncbi:hypothetical protein KQI38_21465 [Tissierella carlieri]|uniref:Uncharacterized protein n=1 Tax=Tissierella carlieri TaxID=689904 RepID=A0ABT1SGZ2_9FIRM|nr:hypothetical protein [Tissierella carlieri]MBU5314597.1 hypothetical protein [Tissierella carlieri]MCQ4925763.1 hypothetical protein [Tissierella carlieri]